MDRRHDLDALRAFAMLLGIALHSALSFTGGPWMVRDSSPNEMLGVLVMSIHGFRMPLFFLLSGFFTAMLWKKRGLKALIAHRTRRVLLPLLLGLVTVVAAMNWVGALAARSEGGVDRKPKRNVTRETPNVWRAASAGNTDLLRQLVDEGSPLDDPDPIYGGRPLGYAAIYGHAEAVRWLIERGADVNGSGRDGGTALHAAAFLGHAGIARTLLEAGADPAKANHRGETPLDSARVDWRTTQFIARTIQIEVEREAVLEGRSEILRMFGEDAEQIGPGSTVGILLLLTRFPLFHHLWFLWFLCLLVAAFAGVAWFATKLGWARRPGGWVTSPWRYLWLVPLTLIPAWFMGRETPNFGPDTSSSLLPPLRLLVYYAIFFGFGALYFGCRDEEGRMGRRWWLSLPVSILVLFPAGAAAIFQAGSQFRPVATLIQVLYVWAMCAGMIGLFRKLLSRERPWVRYLSDASYWMYVAHMPLVLAAQWGVRDWSAPVTLKFLVVCGSVGVVLLVSYELLVRYTWVGALLNGRKFRPAR